MQLTDRRAGESIVPLSAFEGRPMHFREFVSVRPSIRCAGLLGLVLSAAVWMGGSGSAQDPTTASSQASGMGGKMTDSAESLQRNIDLVRRHFDEFVNKQDPSAVERNFSPDFDDHNMPGGAKSVAEAARGAKAVFQRFPDLRVEIRDIVAQGDRVAVRAVWIGHEHPGGRLKEFHGFVLWRVKAGKLVERWATTTSMREVDGETFAW